MNYISQGKLSIASALFKFVNNELLSGTNIDHKIFWTGLDECAHELAPKNKNLLNLEKIYKNKSMIFIKVKKERKLILKNI